MAANPIALGRVAMPWEKLLLRAPNWIGDTIMMLPALAALRRCLPDTRIDVMTVSCTGPIGEGHIVLRHDVGCNPCCRKGRCSKRESNEITCMEAIASDQVGTAARTILDGQSEGKS